MVNDRGLMTNGEILRHSFELVSSSAVPIIIAGLCLYPVNLAGSLISSFEQSAAAGSSAGDVWDLASALSELLLTIPSVFGVIWLSRWTAGRTQGEHGVNFFEDGMGFADIARTAGLIAIGMLLSLIALSLPIGLALTQPKSMIIVVAGFVVVSPLVFCILLYGLYAGTAVIFHCENPITAIKTSIRLVRSRIGETFALLVLLITCHAVLSQVASEHTNPDGLLAALTLRFADSILMAFFIVFFSIKYLSLRPLGENDARVDPDISVAE